MRSCVLTLSLSLAPSLGWAASDPGGRTEIARWQDDKRAAVSLTFDDGTINQFRVAVPIMDARGLPATFFIITGNVSGSKYHGTFIGRKAEAIVQETATIPTNGQNFFERASAIGYLGYQGTLSYHSQAGEQYEDGQVQDAYRLMDEAYAKVREGAFTRAATPDASEDPGGVVTWEALGALARRGHEIASHTVTHPRLAVLDEPNLVYELEKSREELQDHLGPKYTFSVECPYGTEDARAVRYALERYPASRNRMPEPFLDELDRSSERDPATSTKPYVQWQRGALTKTPPTLMKSWIDTVAGHDNMWLVLVFHGVDGIGWEPRTGAELTEYFEYIKSREGDLWVATFQDVAKYLRERAHAKLKAARSGDTIRVTLTHDLTDARYDLPLTLRTAVPSNWPAVEVRQGDRVRRVESVRHGSAASVLYQATPNAEPVTLTKIAN
jgi:peptidoglycan/xylan/chitin deacetylase (PgdA/CDA1 family)